jgi:ATP-dependent RNA helicase RhlE
VLVFTRMKHGANRLAEYLNDNAITAMAIHGNKSQTARTRALAEFKSGDLQVLVATDIAARGIDIDQLPHVVNFEMPNVPEDYVHRIGRTGRAGAQGRAVSLVCVDEDLFLRDIERLIKRAIPREVVPGFEPDPGERAEPIVLGRTTIGVRGPAPSTTRGAGGGGAGRDRAPGRPSKGSGPAARERAAPGAHSSDPSRAAKAADRRPPGTSDHRPAGPHERRAPGGARPSHSNRSPAPPHGTARAAGSQATAPKPASGSSGSPRSGQRSALTSSRKDSDRDR